MKRAFFLAVIAYSAMMLITNDWPAAISNTGTHALPWMAKCLVDFVFAGVGVFKIFGKLIHFDEDEVGVHEDDITVPDTWLYGLFGLNLLANWGWHGYLFATEESVTSFYNSIWWFAESLGMGLTFLFYKNAVKVAQREYRKQQTLNSTPIGNRRA